LDDTEKEKGWTATPAEISPVPTTEPDWADPSRVPGAIIVWVSWPPATGHLALLEVEAHAVQI
jgi:hypothetical protein